MMKWLNSDDNAQSIAQGGICYNIITDGEPNDRRGFEQELRAMANNTQNVTSSTVPSVFLTINLCTDEDSVVDYYNDLDKSLGSELSGLDVIDDFEAEGLEIRAAGNLNVFTYSFDMHVCRMSGCHSVVADLLDEERLSMFHCAKLVRELLFIGRGEHSNRNSDPVLWYDNPEIWLQEISVKNRSVWDFNKRRFCPLVNVDQLRVRMDEYKQANQLREWWIRNIGNIGADNYPLIDFRKNMPRMLIGVALLLALIIGFFNIMCMGVVIVAGLAYVSWTLDRGK
jgi:hypothetical protein